LTIRVGTYLPESFTNGPGLRSVLWVQGCPKRCKGCWNPQFLVENTGVEWTFDEAFERLTESNSIEGITLLGGEPFIQAESLTELCMRVKSLGLTIMAYSGWTYEELLSMGSPKTDLLKLCDILIDGEYVQSMSEPLLWRGSKNQKVYFLSKRYIEWENRVNEIVQDFEVIIQGEKIILTGDPPNNISKYLMELVKWRQYDKTV